MRVKLTSIVMIATRPHFTRFWEIAKFAGEKMTSEEIGTALQDIKKTAEINRTENRQEHQQIFGSIGDLKEILAGLDGVKIEKIEERVQSLEGSRSEGWGIGKFLVYIIAAIGAIAGVAALIWK
jgi:hypothetical protein